MPIRELTSVEAARHKALLGEVGEVALLMPTPTILEKNYFDATISVRALLREKKLHDYALQDQGPEAKVLLQTKLVSEENIVSCRTSLYRPKTKQGDPRIWFTGLKEFAAAGEILAVFTDGSDLALVNLTRTDVTNVLARGSSTEMGRFLAHISGEVKAIAMELLTQLRLIARTPVLAVCKGDTAVGRTLETLLGISQNCSQAPDYKGIELKSSRALVSGRSGLFAQVPDWKTSYLKSSAEILDRFGYEDEETGGRRLYCTVSSRSYNPRGLRLSLEMDDGNLAEISNRKDCPRVVNWALEGLHERLLTKHRETFWIKATTSGRSGAEYLHFESVRHTSNPSLVQFDELLATGSITVDHLIKSKGKSGAQEKGPLFKVSAEAFSTLFPEPRNYSLREGTY